MYAWPTNNMHTIQEQACWNGFSWTWLQTDIKQSHYYQHFIHTHKCSLKYVHFICQLLYYNYHKPPFVLKIEVYIQVRKNRTWMRSRPNWDNRGLKKGWRKLIFQGNLIWVYKRMSYPIVYPIPSHPNHATQFSNYLQKKNKETQNVYKEISRIFENWKYTLA